MSNNFKKNLSFPNYWNWNGFKVCWSVIGEDNEIPIVFLHGFGASRKHWRNNLEFFAKRNCASYSLDLIGFGDSDQPGIREIGKLNNEIWSNQVRDFIEQAKEAVLAGADSVLLDELSPEIIKKNVQDLRDLSMNSLKKEVNKNLIIEVSGINPEEISKYLIKGIDLISTSSSITKSNWIDLSMRYIN